MTTLPLTEPVALEVPPLPRSALDELYHFLQYLEFKYQVDLESTLEVLEDEIDSFDADAALEAVCKRLLSRFSFPGSPIVR
ncbi:MAG: hypothetical protein OHK0047_29660 [Leptolyngbyaceae cyanobacterium]